MAVYYVPRRSRGQHRQARRLRVGREVPNLCTILLLEALDVISSTTFQGAFYGITLTLYCLCARSLLLNLQTPDKQRRAQFSLFYISFLFFCITGSFAVNGRLIQVVYINHANFPGGPLEYEVSYNSTIDSNDLTGSILNCIIDVLTSAIQIRRLWIIWSGTRYAAAVTVLPMLLLLAYIALYIPTTIVLSVVPLDIPGNRVIQMETAFYAIQSGFTILVTTLIVARLLRGRKQHMTATGMSEASSPYLSIIAMLVESYALESGWSLVTSILRAVKSPGYSLFVTVNSSIKIVAYYLVVYRVETGKGWTKKTEEKLTSLRWNHDTRNATDEASGI